MNCSLALHFDSPNVADQPARQVPHRDVTLIKIANVTHHWTTGKALVFDDSFEHEVTNDSDKERVVLIVDVWHKDVGGIKERQEAIRRLESAGYPPP